MLDAAALDTIEKVGGALLIGALHAYYAKQRSVTRGRIEDVAKVVATDYADLHGELDAVHSALEALTVKINGGDRRKARPQMSNADAADIRDQARRWKDFPNAGQPAGNP